VVGTEALVAAGPDLVIEAASHDAVREHAERLLDQRISVMLLSGGALADDALRQRLEHAARANRAMLYVPSGGIGGLDALKAACAAGVDEVSIAVTKPPAAWKGIPYVERLGLDLDRLAGATTLFEGSARDGVRFPGHAVVQFRTTRASEWLVGVDVLDRDDVSLLPVLGVRWAPYDELRLDLMFPRPSVALRLSEVDHWAYLRGELGGGSWAIERVDLTSDNATYRDFRLAFGIEDRSDADGGAAVELAYVFGRELTYRSGNGNMDLKDAVMLSFGGTY
jgi:hypothetical protein